jgi:hypothetical protein
MYTQSHKIGKPINLKSLGSKQIPSSNVLTLLIKVLNLCNERVDLGLWCLIPFSTIFQLYGGGNQSTREKPLT